MKQRTLLTLAALAAAIGLHAQTASNYVLKKKQFDIAVTGGTTGIGIDMGYRPIDLVRVRAGFSWMPHWKYNMTFGVELYDDLKGERYNDPIEKREKAKTFKRWSGYLQQLTGLDVNPSVDMVGEPTYWNGKILFDIYPLKDKRWRFTTGLFIGPRRIAKAYNTTESMPSLLAMNIYNSMYDKALRDEPLLTITNANGTTTDINIGDGTLQTTLINTGRMGIFMGKYTYDTKSTEELWIYRNGEIVHVEEGEVRQNAPYMMMPGSDGMAKAEVLVNCCKYYLGLGFDTNLSKDDDWTLGLDAGIMLWGGSPSVITHDGTDLMYDVTDVPGKVGDYVNGIRKFKVMPVLELRLAKKIF
jgi:hypothetical protein